MATKSKQAKVGRTVQNESIGKSEPTITCPKCGTVIKLTESLAGPLVEQTRLEYERRLAEIEAVAAKREKELQARETEVAKEKARVRQQVAAEIQEERAKMEAAEAKKNAAMAKREKALRDKEKKVADALSSVDDQVAEKLKLEQSRIIAEAEKKAKRAVAIDLEQRDREVTELQALLKQRDERLAETTKKEAELLRKQREFEAAKQEQDLIIEQRVRESVAAEGERLRKEAEAAANRKIAEQQKILDDMNRKLGESQKAEADFMRQKRELEEKLREADLKVEKGVRERLAAVQDQTRKEVADSMQMKLEEKDMKIAGMQKTIAELQQKAEQGSQQAQGEVEELAVENELRAKFPRDNIVPVPKGKAGADVLQHVVSVSGLDCGTIIWECKRTRNWSNSWLGKLRTDQRAEKAELAVLVTQVLPPNVGAFDYIDDVWVTRPDTAMPIAIALRNSLEEVALARQAATGQHEKTDLLYQYMTGPQFRQRVAAIVEAFATMRRDLDREKMVLTKQWAKRETQITLAMTSTVGMYADLQAIAGPTLQQIDGLEIEALEAPDALDAFFGTPGGQGSKG